MEYSVATEARAIMDEAAILGMRRGKYYVGVEFVFEALMTKPDLLPDSFAKKYIQAFTPALNEVRQTEWKGVSPVSDDGEVYYTPRAQEVVREAAKLAQNYRRGAMMPAHLLLVILQQNTSEVCRAIDAGGLDRAAIYADLHEILLSQNSETRLASSAGTSVSPGAASGADSASEQPAVSVESFTTDLARTRRRFQNSLLRPGPQRSRGPTVEIRPRTLVDYHRFGPYPPLFLRTAGSGMGRRQSSICSRSTRDIMQAWTVPCILFFVPIPAIFDPLSSRRCV